MFEQDVQLGTLRLVNEGDLPLVQIERRFIRPGGRLDDFLRRKTASHSRLTVSRECVTDQITLAVDKDDDPDKFVP